VAGCCEYGDEPSGSMKCVEYLDVLASQEGLCSMELVRTRPVLYRIPGGSMV
jgi:hypothetical protein